MECFGIAAFIPFKSHCPQAKYSESCQKEARWLMQWRMKDGTYIEKGRGKMDSNLPGKPTTTSSFFPRLNTQAASLLRERAMPSVWRRYEHSTQDDWASSEPNSF
jgi:hypothetical protein